MNRVPEPMVSSNQKNRFVAGPTGRGADGLGTPSSGVQLLHAPVLVLNLNYVPLNICTVRRARAKDVRRKRGDEPTPRPAPHGAKGGKFRDGGFCGLCIG